MPGMPFHLEKGHALMAIEELLNNHSHHAVLEVAYDGLRTGQAVGTVFRTALMTKAPVLDAYEGEPHVTAAGGLGPFVTGAWFGQIAPGTATPNPYWLDYQGDVDGIVREALLFAMEIAWGADRTQKLPPGPFVRRIELLWHCAQRWFDAWTTWDDPNGPVKVLFATPPHSGGTVTSRIDPMVTGGKATPVVASTVDKSRAMVLISQPTHAEVPMLTWKSVATPLGSIPLPSIGTKYQSTGAVGRWRIHPDAGGSINPPTPFA
jgi:hypothetical protein